MYFGLQSINKAGLMLLSLKYFERAVVLFNRNLPIRCHKTSLRDDIKSSGKFAIFSYSKIEIFWCWCPGAILDL